MKPSIILGLLLLGSTGAYIGASIASSAELAYFGGPMIFLLFLYGIVHQREQLEEAKQNLYLDLAKIQHEAWRQLPQNKGSPWNIAFEDLPELQVDKNVAGVTAILSELKRRGLLR